MSLDQQVGLGVGVVEFRPNQLERDAGGELPQEGVLLVADGEVLVLGGRRENFDQSPQFGLVIERHTEQLCVGEERCVSMESVEDIHVCVCVCTNCGIVDVVVGSDHPKIER